MQPPFWPNIGVFFQLGSFETKNIDVEQGRNLKSEKKRKKIREKDLKEKTKTGTGNPKKEGLMKQVAIEDFDVVPFMKQKQRRQKNKEGDQNKEPK